MLVEAGGIGRFPTMPDNWGREAHADA